jgi:hypothetical protein
VNSLQTGTLQFYIRPVPDPLSCNRERFKGIFAMNTQLQQSCAAGQMSLEDGRNIRLLTILSNLVVALVLGIGIMLASFGWILFT